jgi:hypothetical protein
MATPTRLPHDPLTPLDPNGDPSPAAVRLLREEMYANARSIQSDYGGGRYGHLGQLMPFDRYKAFAGVPYILPKTPPKYTSPPPAHSKWWKPWTWFNEEDDTQDKDEAKAQFETSKADWEAAQSFKRAMQQLIIKAVPKVHLAKFRCSYFGFSDIDPGEVLEYLIDKFGLISLDELHKNFASLKAPWNPDTAISTLFAAGDTCRKFASDGNDPISDKHYITTMVKTIHDTGVLTQALYAWRTIPDVDKTVDSMIEHFSTADKVRRDHPEDMRGVLTANSAEGKPAPVTPSPRLFTPYTYCWSHGSCAHTSDTCKHPKPGHNSKATFDNWEELGGKAPKRQATDKPHDAREAKRPKRGEEANKRKEKEKDEARAMAALAEARIFLEAKAMTESLMKTEE